MKIYFVSFNQKKNKIVRRRLIFIIHEPITVFIFFCVFQIILVFIAGALAAPSSNSKSEEKSDSNLTLHLQKRQAGPSSGAKPYSDALAYFNNFGSWPAGYTQHYSLLNYNGLNPTIFNPTYRLQILFNENKFVESVKC